MHPLNDEDTANLYAFMDVNFEELYPEKEFWRPLHKIDQELKKGCIFVEKFGDALAKGTIRDMRGNADARDAFFAATDTIVIRVQNPKTALEGAALLNDLAKVTSTVKFIPERVTENGVTHYQIRSNIEKEILGQLAAVSKFLANRELSPQERREKQRTCQGIVSEYTKKTDCAHWRAHEGMLAFCTLMGLHGNLRPYEKNPPDARRKSRELNEHGKQGKLPILEGISIHVDVNKHGSIQTINGDKNVILEMPQPHYTIGYNPRREAWERSHENLPGMGIEAVCTTNPFEKHLPLSNRILKLSGLITAGVALSGLAEPKPMTIAIVGMSSLMGGVLIGYAHKSWEVIGHVNKLRKEHPQAFARFNRTLKQHRLQGKTRMLPALEKITTADMSGFTPEEREAFSGEGLKQLEALLKREIEAENAGKPHVAALNGIADAKKPDPAKKINPDNAMHSHAASLIGGLGGGYRFK